jgi:hypothetical protein
MPHFPPGLSLFGLGRLENEIEAILGTRVAVQALARSLEKEGPDPRTGTT